MIFSRSNKYLNFFFHLSGSIWSFLCYEIFLSFRIVCAFENSRKIITSSFWSPIFFYYCAVSFILYGDLDLLFGWSPTAVVNELIMLCLVALSFPFGWRVNALKGDGLLLINGSLFSLNFYCWIFDIMEFRLLPILVMQLVLFYRTRGAFFSSFSRSILQVCSYE